MNGVITDAARDAMLDKRRSRPAGADEYTPVLVRSKRVENKYATVASMGHRHEE
jgi:hypothetical protein